MATPSLRDWFTSPLESAKALAGGLMDTITKWATKKAGDVMEGAARERLGPVADIILPPSGSPGGSPAPQRSQTGGSPSPSPSAAPPGTDAPPAGGTSQDRPWYAGIVDGFKKLFGKEVDTSGGSGGQEQGKGFDWGKLAKNAGTYGLALLGGLAAASMFGGGGFLGTIMAFAVGYAISMAIATPLVKGVGNFLGNVFSKSGGESPSQEQAQGQAQGQAPVVVIPGRGAAANAPAREEGPVDRAVSAVKGWMGTASDYVVDKWERVANLGRRMVNIPEKPLSRVLDYTDKLNIPALEKQHSLPPGLLSAVMHAESAGDRYARSGAGAEGLMQFMPTTSPAYGMQTQQDRFDPKKSVEGAAKYLGDLSKQFNGHVPSMLAAYNWGPGRVAKFNTDGTYVDASGATRKYSPPEETKSYVSKIMGMLPMYEQETIRIAAAKGDTTLVAHSGAGRTTASGGGTSKADDAKARAAAAVGESPRLVVAATEGPAAPGASPVIIDNTAKPRVVLSTSG